jgi:hypothetical protein
MLSQNKTREKEGGTNAICFEISADPEPWKKAKVSLYTHVQK